MSAVIAIVGQPNVGKSTLFNRLTRSRRALVADRPGVTRDRQYAMAHHQDATFILVDTGGIGDLEPDHDQLQQQVETQALQAAAGADAVIWLVDGRGGLTAGDEHIVQQLRPLDARLYLAINKTEGHDPDLVSAEFHALGIEQLHAISAQHGDGVIRLIETIIADLGISDTQEDTDTSGDAVKISIVGRPNVGKSTLINRILGEDRMLTCDHPGTTRDSIAIPFTRDDCHYLLIDTAGMRRKSRITDAVEKFSVIKALKSVDMAQVVVLVIDASEAFTEQDLHLVGLAHEQGKPVIIAVNKWDGIEPAQRTIIRNQLDRKLRFLQEPIVHFISALHGSGVGNLMKSVKNVSKRLHVRRSSARITRLLEQAVQAHPPPLVRGRRIKLRYAHIGGHSPLRIIVHGNQVREIPDSYHRYLCHAFQKGLDLKGIPVIIEYKQGENPYAGRKNKLTDRQMAKRRRMIKYNKKQKR
ncbi:MAG: ribosome biogenesis GTPase Der [Thiotrichales bacterium]|nr:ribosome biogenesis GTPase Der [Thiotrichales bacterium]